MTYPAPEIPELPCPAINAQLQDRFSQPADNILKSVISHYICSLYRSTLRLSHLLNDSSPLEKLEPRRRRFVAWTTSCVVVAMSMMASSFLMYRLACSYVYLLDAAVKYLLVGLGWVALAVGGAGVYFYDNEPDENGVKKKDG